MNREMLKECIADAKTIKETAIASAKVALEEAFAPTLMASFAEQLNELDLDKALPKVNVVPQDIGRVLLNLINNAFYAVSDVEKPKVIVTTKNLGDKIIHWSLCCHRYNSSIFKAIWNLRCCPVYECILPG